MNYVLKIFRTRCFRRAPVTTLYRAVVWILFYVLPKRTARIMIRVGTTSFLLDVPPLLRQGGSTGIFIQREDYEPLLRFAPQLVKPGAMVFDCGANQGIYACAFAALVGPSGKVIAFEPQDYAIDILKHNLIINGFDHVTIEKVAVSDHAGSAVLDASRGAVSASIVRDFGGKDQAAVPTARLSDIAERLGIDRLDVIKMDIEGAEYVALCGAEGLLRKYKPTVIVEASSDDPTWVKIKALLAGHGYTPFTLDEHENLSPVTVLSGYEPDIVFLPHDRRAGIA